MLLFPLAFLAGVVLGWLRGGGLRSLSVIRLPSAWLVGGALGFQLVLGMAGWTGGPRLIVLLVSYGMTGTWLVLMLRAGPLWWRCGFGCVTVGYALNLAAIVPNGSMPVSVPALRRVGASPEAFQHGTNLHKHVPAHADTVLAWLGDVVAVRSLGAVISVGDIAMLIGVATIAYAGMTSLTLVPSREPLSWRALTPSGARSWAAGRCSGDAPGQAGP